MFLFQEVRLLHRWNSETLSPMQAKALEAAWQLSADHILQIESSKTGSWQQVIVPALESCWAILGLSPGQQTEAAIFTTEAAFTQFAKG